MYVALWVACTVQRGECVMAMEIGAVTIVIKLLQDSQCLNHLRHFFAGHVRLP